MTYLTTAEVKDIVRLCGLQIRLFLGNADLAQYSGDAKVAIEDFHRNPASYSDERLLEKGADVDAAHQYNVRIELRSVQAEGAAQVVAKGIWGESRQQAVRALRLDLTRHSHPLIVRTAGSSSFEFNRLGVDKSLPLHYLRQCFNETLDKMRYVAGTGIDSRKSRIVIASDGDGTIFEGPKLTHLPLLKDSPVFRPIVAYLKAGGIFMVISGNDLTRTFKRVIEGFPKEVFSRVLIAANGGADLVCIDAHGKPMFISGYRNNALAIVNENNNGHELDIVYIGDDGSDNGNDRAAFEAVGKDRSVLVNNLKDTKTYLEQWLHEREIGLA